MCKHSYSFRYYLLYEIFVINWNYFFFRPPPNDGFVVNSGVPAADAWNWGWDDSTPGNADNNNWDWQIDESPTIHAMVCSIFLYFLYIYIFNSLNKI